MGTEDETDLSLQNRAIAAAGAALVAACIVNPLDVIKTRIQAQAMAEAAGGQRGCSTPMTCTSTLYEHAALHPHGLQPLHGLSDCQHSHNYAKNPAAARSWLHQRATHTLCPETAAWLAQSSTAGSSSNGILHGVASGSTNALSRLPARAGATSGSASAAAAAASGISAARTAAVDKAAAAAAAAFRRWGITEGPLLIRRTPPYPVPYGWSPAPVAAAAAAAPGAAAAVLAGAGSAAGSCPACVPPAAAAAVPNNSMWEMAKTIRAREGLPVLWRGTSASLLIAVPMVGIYMPLYDSLLDSWSSKLGSLAPVVSGTAARAGAVFCVAPFELLRTRIQATSAAGASLRSTLATFVNEHQQPTVSASAQVAAQQQHPQAQALQRGVQQAPVPAQQQLQPAQVRPGNVLRAVPRMWTGFSATLVRDVPFSALYWALVEPLRQAMLPLNSHWPPLQCIDKMLHHKHATSSTTSISAGSGSAPTAAAAGAVLPPSQQRLMHHSQLEILIANLVSGFVAGGLAAGITTPFDVVKTRMQIASPSQQQQQGLRSNGNSGGGIRVFNILAEVYRKEGMEGLFSGLKPRAARAAPACAIVISVYELLKSQLTPARQ